MLAAFVRWVVLGLVWAVSSLLSRGRIRVHGEVPHDLGLVVFHHNAPLDAIVLAHPIAKAGHIPIAMVKASVFRHRIVGPIVRTAGMVPVARGMSEGRAEAYDAAVEHLRRGHSVFVAPGGTISQTQVVEPDHWRHGAARMAREAGVPITPAVVLGPHRWGGNGKEKFTLTRVPIDIWIGEPIEVDEDPTRTNAAVASALGALLDRAYDGYAEPGPGQWWWPADRGGSAPAA